MIFGYRRANHSQPWIASITVYRRSKFLAIHNTSRGLEMSIDHTKHHFSLAGDFRKDDVPLYRFGSLCTLTSYWPTASLCSWALIG